MMRYNDEPELGGEGAEEIDGYVEGVDRVLEYIESIHAYPKLLDELKWAIKEGII